MVHKKKAEANNTTMIYNNKASNLDFALKDIEIKKVNIINPDNTKQDFATFKTYMKGLAYYKFVLKEKQTKRKIMEIEIKKIRTILNEYNDVIEYFHKQEEFIINKILDKLPDKNNFG